MPLAVLPSLVAPEHANRPEADPLVGSDRPGVVVPRVDREPVVPADVDEMARERLDGLAAESDPLEVRAEKEVDPCVPVVRVLLLVELDGPGHGAADDDDQHGHPVAAAEPGTQGVRRVGVTPPSADGRLVQDLLEGADVFGSARAQQDPAPDERGDRVGGGCRHALDSSQGPPRVSHQAG